VTAPPLLLHRLPWLGRIGLSLLLLTVAGGLVASAGHLVLHHRDRDETPGLSMQDIRGVYHGVTAASPMLAALQRGHPEDLPAAERDALVGWLQGDRISERYDSLDLGDAAPAEVIQRRCLGCHARGAAQGGGIDQHVPLDYWDDVKAIAFSRHVEPNDAAIVVASAHTHALGMGSLSLVLCLLAMLTRWPPLVVSLLVLASGAGLLVDLSSWLPARSLPQLVPLLVGGGAAWMASTALLLALVLLDLWLPAPRRPSHGA
jgi:hypothetical protein